MKTQKDFREMDITEKIKHISDTWVNNELPQFKEEVTCFLKGHELNKTKDECKRCGAKWYG